MTGDDHDGGGHSPPPPPPPPPPPDCACCTPPCSCLCDGALAGCKLPAVTFSGLDPACAPYLWCSEGCYDTDPNLCDGSGFVLKFNPYGIPDAAMCGSAYTWFTTCTSPPSPARAAPPSEEPFAVCVPGGTPWCVGPCSMLLTHPFDPYAGCSDCCGSGYATYGGPFIPCNTLVLPPPPPPCSQQGPLYCSAPLGSRGYCQTCIFQYIPHYLVIGQVIIPEGCTLDPNFVPKGGGIQFWCDPGGVWVGGYQTPRAFYLSLSFCNGCVITWAGVGPTTPPENGSYSCDPFSVTFLKPTFSGPAPPCPVSPTISATVILPP